MCFCKRKTLGKGTSFPVASCVLQPSPSRCPQPAETLSSGRGDMLPSAAREVSFPLTKAGQCGSLMLWRTWQGFLSPRTPGICEVVLLKQRGSQDCQISLQLTELEWSYRFTDHEAVKSWLILSFFLFLYYFGNSFIQVLSFHIPSKYKMHVVGFVKIGLSQSSSAWVMIPCNRRTGNTTPFLFWWSVFSMKCFKDLLQTVASTVCILVLPYFKPMCLQQPKYESGINSVW